MTKQFTASTKKYDPDDEDQETFDTWDEAEEWLLDQQKYGRCSMRINGERVRIHAGHVVNDEPELQPAAESATFQVVDEMVKATAEFNRKFRPQPTRNTVPTNPATRDIADSTEESAS